MEDQAKGQLMESKDSHEYLTHLEEAKGIDFSDLESTGCVTFGRDLKSNQVIIVLPELALARAEKQEITFRRVLLLFIKKAHDIIATQKYSIVYGHCALDVINQYPLIYKYYSLLPREYKKHLEKMYILNANLGIKMFFEFSRVFLSHKFYAKLLLLDSIVDFQKYFPPTQLSFPTKFYSKDDEKLGLKYQGYMVPLRYSFDYSIGTIEILSICARFLRRNKGLLQEGIFRIPGNEMEINLARHRLQYSGQKDLKTNNRKKRIHLSETENSIILGNIEVLLQTPTTNSNSNLNITNNPAHPQVGKNHSHNSSFNSLFSTMTEVDMNKRVTPNLLQNPTILKEQQEIEEELEKFSNDFPPEVTMTCVSISNVNTVAQIFKMVIRDLHEPLFPPDAYRLLIDFTRKYDNCGKHAEWETDISQVLGDLPFEHLSTLVFVTNFLREVTQKTAQNNMDSNNLAIIFTPTLFRSEATEAMKALMEMKFSQMIVKEMLDRRSILQKAMRIHLEKNKLKYGENFTREFIVDRTQNLLLDSTNESNGLNQEETGLVRKESSMSEASAQSQIEGMKEISDGLSTSMLSRMAARGGRNRDSNSSRSGQYTPVSVSNSSYENSSRSPVNSETFRPLPTIKSSSDLPPLPDRPLPTEKMETPTSARSNFNSSNYNARSFSKAEIELAFNTVSGISEDDNTGNSGIWNDVNSEKDNNSIHGDFEKSCDDTDDFNKFEKSEKKEDFHHFKNNEENENNEDLNQIEKSQKFKNDNDNDLIDEINEGKFDNNEKMGNNNDLMNNQFISGKYDEGPSLSNKNENYEMYEDIDVDEMMKNFELNENLKNNET